MYILCNILCTFMEQSLSPYITRCWVGSKMALYILYNILSSIENIVISMFIQTLYYFCTNVHLIIKPYNARARMWVFHFWLYKCTKRVKPLCTKGYSCTHKYPSFWLKSDLIPWRSKAEPLYQNEIHVFAQNVILGWNLSFFDKF